MGLQLCSESIRRFEGSDWARDLGPTYGDRPALLAERRAAYLEALGRFLDAFGDLPVAIYRCPARISLNPHSDHQGAWVPYGTHARELLAVCSPTEHGSFEIVNVDPRYASPLAFSVEEEIAAAPDAWNAKWLTYIEHPEVVRRRSAMLVPADREGGERSTVNYVKAAALRLRRERPHLPDVGLRMAFHGSITPASGLSSSSAIVVATACALNDLTGAQHPRRALAELCGEAEWYVGTRGGSGDHAAMLLGHRMGLTHLCFRPPFGVRGILYSPFPADHQLILAGSRRRAEKGAGERLFFNRGVFAYRFAFQALHRALSNLAPRFGLEEAEVEDTLCLADIHTERFQLWMIYRLLLQVPERVRPADLQQRHPATFAPAARSCFGTEALEDLPDDIPLRGAAMYGLGRVDRGLVMPALLAKGDAAAMAEFGRLMSITHDGDRLTRWQDGLCADYHENQERLAEANLSELLESVRNGPADPRWAEAQLRRQPGFYGASIPELDRIVDAVLPLPAVRGAGLMGAGGGGYVLILAEGGDQALASVRSSLETEYYLPLNLEPDVERWQPTDAAGQIRSSAG
jgi:N-acetylgalactosamine kinase